MTTDGLGAVDMTVIGYILPCARAVPCRLGELRGKLAPLTDVPLEEEMKTAAAGGQQVVVG